jgi:hypothetical protein
LGELVSVDVPLDLYQDYTTIGVESEDVNDATPCQVGLATDPEEGFPGEVLQVCPGDLFDLVLVGVDIGVESVKTGRLVPGLGSEVEESHPERQSMELSKAA